MINTMKVINKNIKRLIHVIKNILSNHIPYITIWTVVVKDSKTYAEIERLMFLRYKSANKAFNELCELADKDAEKYELHGCDIIMGGEPLWLYYIK